jgi:hypothetical protein
MRERALVLGTSLAQAAQIAEEAIRSSGVSLQSIETRGGSITAETRPSARSWGEVIEAGVAAHSPGAVTVRVASESRAQLFDWGKNQENVDKVYRAIVTLASSKAISVK